MGIPHYYREIINNYKNIIVPFTHSCTRLFIDFNSVIHQSSSAVVSLKPHTYTYTDIFEEIVRNTNLLIEKCNPQEFVYIAVDGVAPRAKMVQQRKRRYIAHMKNHMISTFMQQNMMNKHSNWDSNIITPGTDFMKQLDIYLKSHFSSDSKQYQVIISGSDEEGEGEQKIFDHMLSCDPSKNTINIINGLDADLIMLSLLSQENILLLRDDKSLVDINMFRESIMKHMNFDNPSHNYMYDYVFLCFLIGNDFLPNVPFLKIMDGAINVLIAAYNKIHNELNEFLVMKDSMFSVNINFLKLLLKSLADNELDNMEYAITHYVNTSIVKSYIMSVPKTNNTVLYKYLTELEQYPLINKHRLVDKYENCSKVIWQHEYYIDLFGSHEPVDIKKYAKSYIEGLLWTTNYYFNRQYDRFWYYKYNTAPLAKDIIQTLVSITDQDLSSLQKKLLSNSLSITITPTLQLLCVLPKHSIVNFLPESKHIVEQNFYMYPLGFKMCTFLKRFLWECTPIIPDVDIEKLYNDVMVATKN